MKLYEYNGGLFWFNPEKAPKNAKEVKPKEPKNKAAKPATK